MKSKITAVILVAAMTVLAACGNTDTVKDAPDPGQQSSSAEKEADVERTDAEKAQLTGELVYWSNWNETETQGLVLAEAIKEFEEQNPGVTITVVWNGRDNKKLLLPALESGQQLDFFEQATDLVMDSLGDYLLDLTPYYSQVYPTTDGKPFEECIMQSPLDLIKQKKTDGIYAVPYQPNLWCIFYNKEHFRNAGIEKVPETWDEFLDTCEKLKAAGYTPLTSDDVYLINALALHMERLKGEEYMHDCVTGEDSSLWEDPAIEQAFSDYKNLIDQGYFSQQLLTNKYPAGQQEMAMGNASMYINGSYLPNEVAETAGPDFEWGAFPYPVLDEAVSDASHVQYNSQALGINKNTKYPEAAFAFAVFITTGKWDQELSDRTMGIPMSTDAEWPAQLQDVKPILENASVRISGSFGLLDNGEKTPVITETFINVLNGSVSPKEAVEKLK